ncbi:MAG: RnfABCDGE type electron transport complex subunit D [bacterium]
MAKTTNHNFILQNTPHIQEQETTPRIMYSVLLALMPATGAGIYFFGLRALAIILTCIFSAVLTETIFCYLRGKPVAIKDGSAVITGLLLALCLPVKIPLTLAALGSVVAIALGKQIFGGLGHNIFNPALVGRAFLQAAFPVIMTTWVPAFFYRPGVEATTTATPLSLMKFNQTFVPYSRLFFGNIGGSIGETSAIAILIGGLFLLLIKNIDWRIPAGFLGTVVVLGELFHLINPEHPDSLSHLLAGGLLLGAFFMATDMVTSPITKPGSWIFGCGAGILLILIRLFGGLPEGVMYSILLMNAITPLINRYTLPAMFGKKGDFA